METDEQRKRELLQVPCEYPFDCGQYYYERKCYSECYDLVTKQLEQRKPCVTVTGSPGIGKSVFYAYFADRYLKTHAYTWIIAVAYSQQRLIRAAVFGESVIRPHPDRFEDLKEFVLEAERLAKACGKAVLVLCDGPPPVWTTLPTVVYTNPDERWLKAVDRLDSTYYMPLWTREELCEAAHVLGLPLAEAEIGERFGTFGGDARYCLHPQSSAVIRAEVNLNKVIRGVLTLDEMDELLTGKESCELRHRLVHYTRREDDPAEATSAFASPFVENTLVDHVLSLDEKERVGIRKWLRRFPFAAKLRQRIYEGETHDALCRSRVLEPKPLDPATPTDMGEGVLIDPTKHWEAEFEELEPSLVTRGPYHKPTSTTWNSVTSFYLPTMRISNDDDRIVTAQEVVNWNSWSHNRLLFLQATVAMTHAVDATGLIRLLNGLGLLESVARNPHRAALVFMVPQKNLDKFRRQVITQPTAESVSVDVQANRRGDYGRAMAAISQYVCSWGE